MNAQRWQQIDDLFHEAVERPPAGRAELLDRDCAADPSLRSEIESLLTAHDRASSSFIEAPAFSHRPAPALLAISPGQRIGRYTVRSVIGLGSMSVVYEAEQDQPRRRVALKILRTGLLSPEMLRRFTQEAELLGRLQHPGIAQIFEAGAGGALALPYMVMELVDGASITRFASERQLDLRERVELLARVCDAVEYAHQKGVIHRDLKPANIVVTADGQPKVLDFGAALLRDPDSSVATLATIPGQLIGTLPYMSPEQVQGVRTRIGPPADVYSLGVILYEFLTGKLPYDLSDMTLVQAAAAICTLPPRRPTEINASVDAVVESIVLGALVKEPSDRYPTAAALAADLRHHLDGEPAAHRATRLSARHRIAFRGAVIGVAALALLLCVAWLLRGARPPKPSITDHPIVMVGSPFRPDLSDYLTSDLAKEEMELRQKATQLPSSKGRAAHDVWRDLGEVLELQGRFAESEEAYREALGSLPDGERARRGAVLTQEKIAGVIAAQGRADEAESIWTDLILSAPTAKLDPWQSARIRLRYGLLLAQQRRRPDAIQQVEDAIRELEVAPHAHADYLSAARALLEDVRR